MSIVIEVSQSLVEVVLPPVAQPRLLRLSVEQYHAMLCHGILAEGQNVELLDGILVEKMTKSTAHTIAKVLAQRALAAIVPENWYVDSQDAITLSTSEPEPDVMVIRGEPRDYLEHHPQPPDLALVVEVSDTSLRHDQGDKKLIYAAAAIAVYWIVNLVERRVEVYMDPTGPDERSDYRQRQDLGETEQVPVVISGREVGKIAVSELLP